MEVREANERPSLVVEQQHKVTWPVQTPRGPDAWPPLSPAEQKTTTKLPDTNRKQPTHPDIKKSGITQQKQIPHKVEVNKMIKKIQTRRQGIFPKTKRLKF